MDLNYPAVKKMVEFIANSMEFNKQPDTLVIYDERDLFWPANKTEHCWLIKFIIGSDMYIGFTGPITWSFAGIDFSEMTKDQLYETYCGWYIVFHTINSPGYEKSKEGIDEALFKKILIDEGFTEICKLQNAFLGGNDYYEFSGKKSNSVYKIVGTMDNWELYPADYILPFFEFIGIGWNPLDK